MNKHNRLFRLWIAFGIKFLKIPYTVNFTPPDEDNLVALGLAWTQEAAMKMQANYTQVPAAPSRKARRVINRAARRAAERRLTR